MVPKCANIPKVFETIGNGKKLMILHENTIPDRHDYLSAFSFDNGTHGVKGVQATLTHPIQDLPEGAP